MSKSKPTTWEICRACALQMVGGPRCYEHNPTPEQREEMSRMHEQEEKSSATDRN